MFFSPSTVAVGGGLVAFLTVGMLWCQNHLLQESNALTAKSINPEQQLIVSLSDQISIMRTITEAIEDRVENQPFGLGSVLHLDASFSCAGKSAFIIESLSTELTFSRDDKKRTVQFLAWRADQFVRIVNPGEIALMEIKLVPAILPDDGISDWTKKELSAGTFRFYITGRDAMGQSWATAITTSFSDSDVRQRPPMALDGLTSILLDPSDDDIPDAITAGLEYPKGNPNRIIGSSVMTYGLSHSKANDNRLVSELSIVNK